MKMPGNMQAMMKQAQQMRERLKEQIAQIRVEASAGGGMVTVKMDGQKNVLGVTIDPEAAGDVEMLQDMIVAACNEAAKKVDDEAGQKVGGMLGGMGLPPGMAISEPVHVPAAEEGREGWLVLVVDSAAGDDRFNSELWIVDAGHVSAGPVAKVKVPIQLRAQVHGWWVPAAELEKARAREAA